MKVALVCPYDLAVPGGVQDQIVRLAAWLRAADHEAVIIGAGEDGPEGSVMLGPSSVIRANRSAVPISVNPRIGSRLQDAAADSDVVHVHEPFMPLIGPAAMRVSGPSVVATFHADPPVWARWGYSIGRRGARVLLNGAGVVTAVSPVAAAAVDQIVRVRIIPNGIDVADYGSSEDSTDSKTAGRVVFVGRDDPRKGLDTLLEAWPEIHRRVPDTSLRVVGCSRSDAPEGVTYLGRVDEETKIAELKAAEVMVAPNTGGESFGIVVLEAMAAGCAVVASGLRSFSALLGDTGSLVSVGDSQGVARAVAELFDDDHALRSRQLAAWERSWRFDGSAVSQAYIEAYEDAMRTGA